MEKALSFNDFVGTADNALVVAYLEGDDYAFEILVSRYQNRLVGYINSMVRDYDRSVDLAQEAFIRVFKNAGRYKGEYQFSTWIYRIATNLAIDELRRRKRRSRFPCFSLSGFFGSEERPLPLPDTRQCPEKTFRHKEKAKRLQSAIDSLPEKYRLPFFLKEIQLLSYEEVAQVLNLSLGTVKSRLHRAKMLLKEKLSGIL